MTANAQIDLTRILDPAELWPDPEACPDWPLDASHVNLDGGSAQRRLESLYQALNRTSGPVPVPTPEQAAASRAEHFRPGPTNIPRWTALGITDLQPASRTSDYTNLMVEAAHIRGHRRKLEARESRRQAHAADLARSAHQNRLDGFPAAQEAVLADLGRVGPGAARHARLEQDEKDYWAWIEAKRILQGIQDDATRAAKAVGVEPPTFKPAPVLTAS